MTHGQTNRFKLVPNPKLYPNLPSKITHNISLHKAHCAVSIKLMQSLFLPCPPPPYSCKVIQIHDLVQGDILETGSRVQGVICCVSWD